MAIGAAVLFLFAATGCVKNPDRTPVLNEDCYYPMVVDPVCGCDGNTYMNSGEAGCHGITEFTAGACQ